MYVNICKIVIKPGACSLHALFLKIALVYASVCACVYLCLYICLEGLNNQ